MLGFLKRNRTFIAAVITILTVRGTFADQNYIPSGSMEPTIHVGDHILVNKLAYDLHLPYMKTTLAKIDDPQRGDIIVFHNPQTDMRMVKRLIGIPGDRIHIQDGFVWVNGALMAGAQEGIQSLTQDSANEIVYSEQIGAHQASIKRTRSLFQPQALDFEVPKGEYFAMGDNRDNSYDSRGWGYIPRANIEGRAIGVIYNLAWNPAPKADWERVGYRFN